MIENRVTLYKKKIKVYQAKTSIPEVNEKFTISLYDSSLGPLFGIIILQYMHSNYYPDYHPDSSF